MWREDFAWWRVRWWRDRSLVASSLVASLLGGEVTGYQNIPGKFPTLLWLFQTSKFQLKATVYALVFTTNLQIHIVNCCINLSFLKILNYSKTIQRLALSFCNPHLFRSNMTKTWATFSSGVHFKPITNLELSNALAHDAKLFLSFITQRKYRDPGDPLRSLITLHVLPPILCTA